MSGTAEALTALREVSVGTVVYVLQNAGLRRCYLTGPAPVTSADRFVGRARTLRTVPVREDVLERRKGQPRSADPHRIAIDEAGAGDVLVIDARRDTGTAVLGDLLLARLHSLGCAAVVTDGCVRDTPAMDELRIPVFAAGRHAGTFRNVHLGIDVNVPVACGGVLVEPGDVLVGDRDGVAVIPAARVEEIAADCVEQEERDEFLRGRITQGVPLAEAYPPNEEIRREYDAYRKMRLRDGE